MNQTYVVAMSNEDVILRVSQTSYGQVKVTPSVVGQVQVLGGVPGPKGDSGESSAELMSLHILDPTPHPTYDDLPSFTLIYENGLI